MRNKFLVEDKKNKKDFYSNLNSIDITSIV